MAYGRITFGTSNPCFSAASVTTKGGEALQRVYLSVCYLTTHDNSRTTQEAWLSYGSVVTMQGHNMSPCTECTSYPGGEAAYHLRHKDFLICRGLLRKSSAAMELVTTTKSVTSFQQHQGTLRCMDFCKSCRSTEHQ